MEWIYPQPSMETLGVTLATDAIAQVETVAVGSPAEMAGLMAGDQIVSVNTQPLVSVADVSWVLHRASDTGNLSVALERGGVAKEVGLELPAGWRMKSDIGRRAGSWPMRAMAFGGMKIDDMTDSERASAGLPNEGMALRIIHVGQHGPHAMAKKAGFQKDDILVQVGEMTSRLTESVLIGRLLQAHLPGENIPAVVLRGGKKVELKLPQQ